MTPEHHAWLAGKSDEAQRLYRIERAAWLREGAQPAPIYWRG